jgi:hypothetical protein
VVYFEKNQILAFYSITAIDLVSTHAGELHVVLPTSRLVRRRTVARLQHAVLLAVVSPTSRPAAATAVASSIDDDAGGVLPAAAQLLLPPHGYAQPAAAAHHAAGGDRAAGQGRVQLAQVRAEAAQGR